MSILKTKLFLVSSSFLALGILSLVLENTFYGYIDDNGILQESFFMPLGFAGIALGVLGLVYCVISGLWRRR